MKLRLLPEAERDLEIAADFYESQRPGLGSYFNDSPDSVIAVVIPAGVKHMRS